jgi:hypothetical protein
MALSVHNRATPNIVLNGYGSISDFKSDELPYDIEGSKAARSLVIQLPEGKNKITQICYAIAWGNLTNATTAAGAARRINARLLVFRRFLGDINLVTFDPFFGPKQKAMPAAVGIDWGLTIELSQQDILFNHLIVQEESVVLPIELEFQSIDKPIIVLTPAYTGNTQLVDPAANTALGAPTSIGYFIGQFTGGQVDDRQNKLHRTLSVYGC